MTITRPAPRLDGTTLEVPEDSFMDPRGYYSKEFFERELRDVFPRTWVFVGDTSELVDAGDFITEFVGYEPIIVVRGQDGRLRAFSNVCTHRASLLAEGTGNCGKTLTCPYHGWTFQLDGRLSGVPYQRDMAGPVDMGQYGLHEIAVDVWEQFVFVNVSRDAPPLMDYLEDIPDLLRNHAVSQTRCIHRLDDVVEANWKIFMDNGFCDYHVPFVHRRLMPMISGVDGFRESAQTWTNVLYTPLSEYGKTFSPPWSALVRGARENTLAIGVFPNLLMIAFVTGDIHLLHWTPMAVDKTRSRVRAYSHSEPDPDDFRYGKEAIRKLQDEDFAVVEKVQKGLRSRLYSPGPRHYLETRLNGFQRTLMRMLGDVVETEGSEVVDRSD